MGGGGGGDDQIRFAEPPIPAPPNLQDVYKQFIDILPQLLQAETQFGPQFAQQMLDLQTQFSPQFAQLYQRIQDQMQPGLSNLNQTLIGQAQQGLNEPVPSSLRNQFVSNFNAELGPNVNAPIGVSERNLGLMNLQEDWKRYYQNLSLGLTGRMPVPQAGPVNTFSPSGGFNFGNAATFAQQGYGPYVGAYSSALQPYAPSQRGGGFSWGGAAGGAAGGALLGAGLAPFTGGLSIPLMAGLGGLGGVAGGFR